MQAWGVRPVVLEKAPRKANGLRETTAASSLWWPPPQVFPMAPAGLRDEMGPLELIRGVLAKSHVEVAEKGRQTRVFQNSLQDERRDR